MNGTSPNRIGHSDSCGVLACLTTCLTTKKVEYVMQCSTKNIIYLICTIFKQINIYCIYRLHYTSNFDLAGRFCIVNMPVDVADAFIVVIHACIHT